MKKFITKALAALMALTAVVSLASCGGEKEPADKRAVLKVGMECGYQPYNWTQLDKSNNAVAIHGKSGQYANGYDVMIAQQVADALDMKLEVYAYEWESLVPAVESGALDLIIAGMSPTEDRKEVIDFTEAYYESNLVVVVRKDGAFADVENINALTGAKLVAQAATFHDTVVDQIEGVLHQTAMEDFPAMISALKARTVDGYIAEEPGAIADCNANEEFTYLHFVNNSTGFAIEDMSNVTLAVGVKKGSALKGQIDTILAGITTDQRQEMMNQAINWAKELGV